MHPERRTDGRVVDDPVLVVERSHHWTELLVLLVGRISRRAPIAKAALGPRRRRSRRRRPLAAAAAAARRAVC